VAVIFSRGAVGQGVARRALRNGVLPEVTWMLTVGNKPVRQLYKVQGKKRIMTFAKQMRQVPEFNRLDDFKFGLKGKCEV
jgi:hypothetical protein